MMKLEAVKVGLETPKSTKDVSWTIAGNEYVVKNVPYQEIEDTQEEHYFDSDVSIRLTMLRDLMVMGEIPPVANYEDAADFNINYSL